MHIKIHRILFLMFFPPFIELFISYDCLESREWQNFGDILNRII